MSFSLTPTADRSTSRLNVLSSAKNDYFQQSHSLIHEIYLILKLSLPIGISIVSEWIPVYAGNAVLGHLDNAPLILAGAGLARTFNNVTGASIGWAFTQGLFTLIPQAIGRNRLDLMSLYFQRASFVCLIIVILLSIIQLFGAHFFMLIGEPREIFDIIYYCCKWGIGNVFALNLVSLLQKFGQAFNYQFELLLISLICGILSYPLAVILIKSEYLNLGYIGCPITVFLLNFLNSFCIIILLIYRGHLYLFIPYKNYKQIFELAGICEYINLCIPALFTNSLEWWIIEITTAISGYIILPDIALSSTIIIGNIQIFTCLLALGNSCAVSIRMGKYIGAELINKAKETHVAGLCVAVIYSVVMILVIYSLCDELPLIFIARNETQIINTTIYGLYMIICGVTFQNLMQLLAGIYRAIGKQKYAAIFISGSYYLIGFSIMLILLFGFDFKNNLVYGVCAIWFGWAISNVIGSISMELFYYCFIDWNNIIRDVNNRIDAASSLKLKSPQFTFYGSVNDVTK